MSTYSTPEKARSSHPSPMRKKPVTVPSIRARKKQEPITMLTAYDYPTARILDEAGIEVILVGDSLATVIYGEPNTLSITVDQMIPHVRAVTRAAQNALVVADMPFMSYQVSPEQAIENAGRFLKESGAQAVKIEGGAEMSETVRRLTLAGIPVMAHIGLTPQSIHTMGVYRMHGKNPDERAALLDSARALTEAGAFAIVLECVDAQLSAEITDSIVIPTIGIGSGQNCDGQVLVLHDLVGLTQGHVPKFAHPEVNLTEPFRAAIERYIQRTKAPKSHSADDATLKLKSPPHVAGA